MEETKRIPVKRNKKYIKFSRIKRINLFLKVKTWVILFAMF